MPTIAEAFESILNSRLSNVSTVMIGRVTAFNIEDTTVDVQPVIKRKIIGDEKAYELPVITQVPVVFPGGGGFNLVFKPAPGDYCILLVSERSIDAWKQLGGIVDPGARRTHNMSDATALIGLDPAPSATKNIGEGCSIRSKDGAISVTVDGNGISLTNNGDRVTVTSSETILTTPDGANTVTLTNSSLTSTVPIVAPEVSSDSGTSLTKHRHTVTATVPAANGVVPAPVVSEAGNG